ncbi:hypothetical protein JA9_001700 [Meyerozyma sp. JA9]|nr:hypothetical protein JA9_001700 [Meyerozyma sp. JA9]
MRYSTTSVALVWFLSLMHAANAVSLSLTARGADHKFHSLGTVELTPEKSEFIAGALALEPGYYCVGTKDLPGHECFTYTYLDGGMDHKAVQVTIDNGQVSHLALIHNDDENVKIVSAGAAPSPNMDPVPLQSKKKKAVQQEEKEEGEEVEKSWIQKNWMYVVPPLMILMMLMPADEERK